jgi:hypothetical protein
MAPARSAGNNHYGKGAGPGAPSQAHENEVVLDKACLVSSTNALPQAAYNLNFKLSSSHG